MKNATARSRKRRRTPRRGTRRRTTTRRAKTAPAAEASVDVPRGTLAAGTGGTERLREDCSDQRHGIAAPCLSRPTANAYGGRHSMAHERTSRWLLLLSYAVALSSGLRNLGSPWEAGLRGYSASMY